MNSALHLPRPALSANTLKLIAVLAMAADHCTTLFLPPHGPLSFTLHAAGQLAAPIMCFFIAEGFQHTSNFRRYLGRLLLAALLSHVPYTLCFKAAPHNC